MFTLTSTSYPLLLFLLCWFIMPGGNFYSYLMKYILDDFINISVFWGFFVHWTDFWPLSTYIVKNKANKNSSGLKGQICECVGTLYNKNDALPLLFLNCR